MDFTKLRDALRQSEALRLKPYRDTKGKLTIGIGRNLDDKGITEDEAYFLNDNDIHDAQVLLDQNLPWWRQLDEVRQRALVELCFNMGIGSSARGLLSFKNTLQYLQAGDWESASSGFLHSKWALDVKATRARRIAEMIRTGTDIPPRGKRRGGRLGPRKSRRKAAPKKKGGRR